MVGCTRVGYILLGYPKVHVVLKAVIVEVFSPPIFVFFLKTDEEKRRKKKGGEREKRNKHLNKMQENFSRGQKVRNAHTYDIKNFPLLGEKKLENLGQNNVSRL